MTTTTLKGDAARALIEAQMFQHEGGVRRALAPYDAQSAIAAWHEVLRGVEEFINVVRSGVAPGPGLNALLACPIGDQVLLDPQRMALVTSVVGECHDAGVVHRFRRTLVQVAEIAAALMSRGVEPAGLPDGLRTIADAAIYLQSRRRHLVSLFYAIPNFCIGSQPLDVVLALPNLAMCVEHSCLTITGLHQQRLLLLAYPAFALTVDERGFRGNYDYEMLEADFLEAERASILAFLDERRDQMARLRTEPTPEGEILSAQELRNTGRALLATYAMFGRDDAFSAGVQIVTALSRLCVDDYFIALPLSRLESLVANQSAIPAAKLMALLVAGPGSYAEQTNRHQPFVLAGETAVSNVSLLGRFLYAFKNQYLESRRRFVIHSGFIFEDQIKRGLAALGYEVTNAKRVGGRSEFDVVALWGDTIFNFQCKNNMLDLSLMEAHPERLARANRRLVTYYRRALKKERARQGLLQVEFGRTKIRHFVISRFPVITDDPLIVNANNLERLAPPDGQAAP